MAEAFNDIDAFCVGFGQWLHGTDERLLLAIAEAEAEWREGGWEALSVVLDHVDDGVVSWPVDAVERARLFEATWRLGWFPGELPLGPRRAPSSSQPTKGPEMTTTDTDAAPATWADVHAKHPTWADWVASERTWPTTNRKDQTDE